MKHKHKYYYPDMTLIALKQHQDFYETKIAEYQSNVAAIKKEIKRRNRAARTLHGGDKISGLGADYAILDDMHTNSRDLVSNTGAST